jgi:hypothetical protein
MRTNYVPIDFANLQPELLGALDLEHFRVMVFIGANQTKVPIDFAAQLQPLGARAVLAHRRQRAQRTGLPHRLLPRRALDQRPDRGLPRHRRRLWLRPAPASLEEPQGLRAIVQSIAEIPHVRAANSKTLSEKVEFVVESLADREGRPATVKTLSSTIECMFPNGLAKGVCGQVIEAMQSSGFITVTGTEVTYAANATEAASVG